VTGSFFYALAARDRVNLCLKVHRQLSIPDWLGKIPVDGHPTQYRWNPVTGKKAEIKKLKEYTLYEVSSIIFGRAQFFWAISMIYPLLPPLLTAFPSA
jgi:hypothetical protein